MKIKEKIMRKMAVVLALAMICSVIKSFDKAYAKKIDKMYSVKDKNTNGVDISEYTLDNMSEVVKNTVYSSDKEPYCLVDNDMNVANSVTVKNTDGSLTTHIFPYNVKENDGRKLKFIGKKIKSQKNKGYDFVDDSGSITRRFSENAHNGIKLENKKISVKLSPLGIVKKSKKVAIKKDYNISKEDNGIIYNKLFSNNIDVEYLSEANGIKENIVLDKYEGINEFRFEIDTNGLLPDKLSSSGESIQLINPNNKKCEMIISPIYLYDSSSEKEGGEKISLNNSMRLKYIEDGIYELTVIADKDFLSSKSTNYPVTVDPSIKINSSSIKMQNVNIYENSNFYKDSDRMHVGWYPGPYFGMSEMYVRLSEMRDFLYISPNLINSVKFNIYRSSEGECYSPRVELYELDGTNWTKDGLCWSSKPKTRGAVQSYIINSKADTWCNFDITSIFKEWLSKELGENGRDKKAGFCLKTKGDTGFVTFNSVYSSDNPPTITVNYREDISLSNGQYYIRNIETGEYLDVSDINDNVMLNKLNRTEGQVWDVSLNSKNDGYLLKNIEKSLLSNSKCLLDTDRSNGDTKADLWNECNGSWVNFRIIKNKDKTYRIMCKYGELYRALTSTIDGETNEKKCIFRKYNKSNSQKWLFEKAKVYNVNNYYDKAFKIRYTNSSLSSDEGINLTNSLIKKHFMNEFDIVIINNTPTFFSSLPDECKLKRGLQINNDTINQLCPGGEGHNPSCTDWYELYHPFINMYPGNDKKVSVLWTGNKLETNRSYTSYNHGIILQELLDISEFKRSRISVLTHELSHQLGAPDHYHEILSDGTCRGGNICSICGINPRPSYCIMNDGWMNDIASRDSSNVWCEQCKKQISDHINEIYK